MTVKIIFLILSLTFIAGRDAFNFDITSRFNYDSINSEILNDDNKLSEDLLVPKNWILKVPSNNPYQGGLYNYTRNWLLDLRRPKNLTIEPIIEYVNIQNPEAPIRIIIPIIMRVDFSKPFAAYMEASKSFLTFYLRFGTNEYWIYNNLMSKIYLTTWILDDSQLVLVHDNKGFQEITFKIKRL